MTKQIERWQDKGTITSDQAEAMAADMRAHLVDEEPAPKLSAPLAYLLAAWYELGPPMTSIQGMAVGLLEYRPMLYLARLAWLDEQDVLHPDDRDAYLELWGELDREQQRIEQERLQRKGDESS